MINTKMIDHLKCFILFLLISTGSHATPIYFENHYYEFVEVDSPFQSNNNSWETANLLASSKIFNNMNGYLATIGSQEENDFLLGLVEGQFTGFNGAWLGGNANQGWLTGPEIGQSFSFTNFGGSEPNNAGYIYMNIGAEYAGIGSGNWADDSGAQGIPSSSDPVIGYFVEYGAANSVPEPSIFLLFSIVLITLIKRKK